jgi:uncharacterized protein (DUF427 family)
MAKAVWNGITLAESDDIVMVEGNAYFPLHSLYMSNFRKSDTEPPTFCHWKGFAEYLDIVVDGEFHVGAAWYYPEPYDEADVITDRVAFWRGVEVTGAPEERGLVEPEPSPRAGRAGWEALCWLLRHSAEDLLTAEAVGENTDIAERDLADIWRVFDVQRYANRYKWRLAGGNGEPLRLERGRRLTPG